jgi:hypothetical protein
MKYEDLEVKRAAKQAAKEKSAASKTLRGRKRKGLAPEAEAGSSQSQSEGVRAHGVQEPAATPTR